MSNYVLICDGAYSRKVNKGGIGIVVLRDSEKILEYSKMYSSTTNNQMELIAIIIGLRFIKKSIDSLIVLSDSMYCIGHINSEWKKNKHIKLWNIFDSEYNRVKQLCSNIEFKYIKGHQNDSNSLYVKYHNQADKLANNASQKL